MPSPSLANSQSTPLAKRVALRDYSRTSGVPCDLPPMSVPSDQKHLGTFSPAASDGAGGMNATPSKASWPKDKRQSNNSYLDQVKLVGDRLVFLPNLPKGQEKVIREESANRTALHKSSNDNFVTEIESINRQKTSHRKTIVDKQDHALELQPECNSSPEAKPYLATTDTIPNCLIPRYKTVNPNRYNQIFSGVGIQTNMNITTALPDAKSRNVGNRSSRTKNHGVGQNDGRSSKWATPAELRGESGIEQNVDPNHEQSNWGTQPQAVNQNHELQDWTGGWAPPPVEWENRENHVDLLILDRVKNWERTCVPLGHIVDIGNLSNTFPGEIAPRVWKPSTIEDIPADTWYSRQMPVELEKVDPDELLLAPWWYAYAKDGTEHLRVIEVPVANLDPKDNDMSKAMQQTSEHILLSKENQNLKKAANERKARAQQRAFEKEVAAYVPPPNKHAPTVNLYIRPAVVADMPLIREIWNYYIEKTIFCPEMQPLTGTQIRARWEDITECNLPFLVAVDGSSKGNRRHGTEGHGRVRSDPILGFAFADDYNDVRGMYRYSVEIDVFVSPNTLRKGVGRCLLDKIMSVLDPCYDIRGGYDFVGDEIKYGPGGKRLVGSIIVNIPYDSQNKKRAMWMQQWLSGWDFEQAGELFDVGHKLKTIVSQIILTKKTGSTIHAWAP